MNKNIPKIGEYYHFWDDGKCSMSRHYICKCERILVPSQAKYIEVEIPEWDFEHNENKFIKSNVYDVWESEVKEHDWLFAEYTDYLIERTKEGGWFSIDIQSSWQGGRLDIDGKIFENVVNECIEYGGDPSGYYEEKY